MYPDYESLGWHEAHRARPALVESFRGQDIVAWYGNIERQLQGFVKDAEQSNNEPYTTKLTTFLNKIWRPNEIDGSINRETVEVLLSGATVLAVDDWTYQNYFSVLRDRLRQVIASEEELPRGPGGDEGSSPLGGTSRGAGGPPLNPEFGPEMGGPGEEPGAEPEIEPGTETEPGGEPDAEVPPEDEFAANP